MTAQDSSTEPAPAAAPELSPWRRFWRRYSPYGEFPRSSVSSLSLHLLLVLLLILMSGALKPKEHIPPGVDVVQVGDEPDAAPGMGDGLPAAGQPLSQTPAATGAEGPADDAPLETMPVEAVNTNVKPTEAAADIDAPTAQDLAVQAATAARSASRAARQARQSLDRAQQRLQQNLGQSGGGGNQDAGASVGRGGAGSGGGGGKGASGRAARNGRWILRFEHTSYEDLLAQYEALGAELALPLPNDKFRFFSQLTSQPPRSQVQNLDKENRLYWLEENPTTIAGVAALLNMTPTAYMLAFLPAALEEKMLKLELSYAKLREDQIAKTEFKVVRRGGGYDVIVFAQEPR
jgi:hypothetical protein